MKSLARALLPALAACTLLSGCVAPIGPVEVTRFHVPEVPLARGTVAVEPASGEDGSSIEFRTYAVAVAQELARVGYGQAAPGGPASHHVAMLSVDRRTLVPERRGSPVSVGVGGGTGTFGSGLGVGVGIDLSGPPPEQVETQMSVTIRDRATGRNLWEGRASFAVRADAPQAQTAIGAAKMAQALFRGFPGESGETIVVP